MANYEEIVHLCLKQIRLMHNPIKIAGISSIILCFCLFSTSLFAQPKDMPMNPEPGKCYAKCANNAGDVAWSTVLCPEQISKSVINQISQALSTAGYDVSAKTKKFTPELKTALRAYQEKNDLPLGNMDMETMAHLGVKY